MILFDTLAGAVGELRSNPFRSVLTTLGIVIAVTAVISVVSILEGMNRKITGQIAGLGSDAMWVSPKDLPGEEGQARSELTYEDAEEIRRACSAISMVAPVLSNRSDLVAGDRHTGSQVLGTTTEYAAIRDWAVDAGRFFNAIEEQHRKNVCVLGRDTAKKLGGEEALLGQDVKIDNSLFRVVGLLERKGSVLGQSQDETVLIPFGTAYKIYGEFAAKRITVNARVIKSEMTEEATEQVKSVLRRRHNIGREDLEDFQVQTQKQILDVFKQTSKVTTLVLVGIVGISLLVGGIGIMNIMLVSVTERTREIGVLKALGAKPKDILTQFLIEAILLSMFGGILGIMAGFVVGIGVSRYMELEATVPTWAIGLSVAFSACVGVFFGMYPAVKAARLNPIDALRWE